VQPYRARRFSPLALITPLPYVREHEVSMASRLASISYSFSLPCPGPASPAKQSNDSGALAVVQAATKKHFRRADRTALDDRGGLTRSTTGRLRNTPMTVSSASTPRTSFSPGPCIPIDDDALHCPRARRAAPDPRAGTYVTVVYPCISGVLRSRGPFGVH